MHSTKLLLTCMRRTTILPQSKFIQQQQRNASLLRRPIRPYTFTQLIMLSDGSTYTQRTTSPAPIYKSTKDTRNHAMWQPSLSSLRNIEQDEAGRLRAFRDKFGRGWDLEAAEAAGEEGTGADEEDSLMDLISGGNENQIKVKEKLDTSVEAKMVTVKGSDGKLVKVPVTKK